MGFINREVYQKKGSTILKKHLKLLIAQLPYWFLLKKINQEISQGNFFPSGHPGPLARCWAAAANCCWRRGCHCEAWPRSHRDAIWDMLNHQSGYSPEVLIWNLKISPWKRRFLWKTIIFRFHVGFRGCKRLVSKNFCKKTTSIYDLTTSCFSPR